jgi:hypothetical protein
MINDQWYELNEINDDLIKFAVVDRLPEGLNFGDMF